MLSGVTPVRCPGVVSCYKSLVTHTVFSTIMQLLASGHERKETRLHRKQVTQKVAEFVACFAIWSTLELA
jgi:hypothetical protein